MANGDMVESLSYTGTDDQGTSYSLSHSKTTSSTVRVFKTLIPVVDSGEVDVLSFAAAAAGCVFTDISKLVLKNTDSTYFVRVRRADTGGDTFDEKLPAGDFTVINTRDINVETTDATGFISFSSIDTVVAQAESGSTSIDLEVFIYHT